MANEPKCPEHGTELEPLGWFPYSGLEGMPGDQITVSCTIKGCTFSSVVPKEMYRDWEKLMATDDLKLLDLARMRMGAALKEVYSQPGSTTERLSSYMAKCAVFMLAGGFMGIARQRGGLRAHDWLTDVLAGFQKEIKELSGTEVTVNVARKE